MDHIGVDIIEIARIERAVGRWGKNFLQRVYTPAELGLYQDKVSSLAARFAGKEAVIKVLSHEGKGIFLKDIEVLTGEGGEPVVHLSGKALKLAERLNLAQIAISLSHSRDYAIAFAVGSR